MPHLLARLPLTALATCLASSAVLSGAIPDARAAEPRPLAYVFDGFDGPDLATAPGLAGKLPDARIDLVQPVPTLPAQTLPTHTLTAPALPQGPVPRQHQWHRFKVVI